MVAQVYQAIFDTSYDIAFRDRLPRFSSGQCIKGYIDPVNDRIVIRRNLAIEERALTLLHEVVHECYPDWSEEDVEACASYTYQNLSDHDQTIVNFLATDPAQTAIPQ
jgi:uncharacterized protein (DUF433 family)